MMVLVVHDRAEVAAEIRNLLRELGLDNENVHVAEDGVSARTALQNHLFDLAIIDLTIPHIKGRTAVNYTTAEGLLLEVFTSDDLNAPGDLIGLTKDASALSNMNSEIGPHLMAVIAEDTAGVWKNNLADRIRYVCKSSNARLRSLNRHYDCDVAIITALDEEFAPYGEIFELEDAAHSANVKSFLFNDRNDTVRRGIACSIGRAGQASSASVTQSVISQFRPRLCLMSGFCGGFSEKVHEGDVILVQSAIDWDYGKWKGIGAEAVFKARPDPVGITDRPIYNIVRDLVHDRPRAHDMILGKAVELSKGAFKELRFKLGPIASGSAVVAEPNIMARIQGLNESILGVDMEAFGFYYAAKYTRVAKPDFIAVKTVVDLSDREKHDRYHAAGSYISAKTVEEIICNRYGFD